MPVNHVCAVDEVAADITFAARDNWLHGRRFLFQRQHERDKGNLFSRDERNFLRHCSNNKFADRSHRQMFADSVQCDIHGRLTIAGTVPAGGRSRHQRGRARQTNFEPISVSLPVETSAIIM